MKKVLKVWRDYDAENPFTNWDCEPDLMYSTGRYGQVTDCSDGRLFEFIKNYPTVEMLEDKLDEVCELLQMDKEYHIDNDSIDDIRYDLDIKDIEQMSEWCEIFGIPYIGYESRGYSQGDWAEVLIVLTDEWFTLTGAPRDRTDKILEDTSKLFDSWVWGDVYGYTVYQEVETVKLKAEEFDNGDFSNVDREVELEIIESCGGYYGDDFSTNGLIDELDYKEFGFNSVEELINSIEIC